MRLLICLRDVKAGILYIRPRDHSIWKPHPNQWRIDLADSTCHRPTLYKKREILVDPYSGLFARISRIFESFEYRRYLTIYQPFDHGLVVDLPRMQLRWHVNKSQRLQSQHLACELDPNQVRVYLFISSDLLLSHFLMALVLSFTPSQFIYYN